MARFGKPRNDAKVVFDGPRHAHKSVRLQLAQVEHAVRLEHRVDDLEALHQFALWERDSLVSCVEIDLDAGFFGGLVHPTRSIKLVQRLFLVSVSRARAVSDDGYRALFLGYSPHGGHYRRVSGDSLGRLCWLKEIGFQHDLLAGGGELAHPAHHSQQFGDLFPSLFVVGTPNDENFIVQSSSWLVKQSL